MRPRPRKASSLSTVRRAAVVATLTALAVIFVSSGSAKPAPVGTYQVCITAGTGLGTCSPTSAGGDYSIVSGLTSNELQVTIKDDTGNQALDYVNLTLQETVGTIDRAASAGALNYSTYASTSTSTTLQLRNLGLAPGGSKTIAFFVNPAAGCTDGNWINPTAQSAANGNFYTFPAPTITGGLTTLVSQGCTLGFTVEPAAALMNTLITGQAYTPGATAVTVAPDTTLPVSLNIGSASITSVAGSADPGSSLGFSGTGPVGFSGGSVAFTALQDSGTGGPFTLTAHADGFADAVSSPFVITQDGKPNCGSCTLSSNNGNNPLVSISTTGGFSFLGASPSGVPLDPANPGKFGYPAGCQAWKPTGGVSGFVEFDGRTDTGTMTISYYVSMKAIKARYGANVGQQFIPICFGAKAIDPITHQAQDCTNPGSSDGGWTGDKLDDTGRFVLGTSTAVCGIGGYYWGIISSYQDKLDQTKNPVVTGFNGPTNLGQNFRTFVITEPSGWDGRGGC